MGWTPTGVILEAVAERYGFGASDVDPGTGLVEPESETTLLGVGGRAGWRF